MCYSNTSVRYQFVNNIRYLVYVAYPVVHEEDLTSSFQFAAYGIPYDFFIKSMKFCSDGLSVGRRCTDYTEVPGTHQRKMKRTWDRGSRKGKHIYVYPHLFEFLFYFYTKLLLFINNHKPQVFELHVFVHDSVCANQDIQFSIF